MFVFFFVKMEKISKRSDTWKERPPTILESTPTPQCQALYIILFLHWRMPDKMFRTVCHKLCVLKGEQLQWAWTSQKAHLQNGHFFFRSNRQTDDNHLNTVQICLNFLVIATLFFIYHYFFDVIIPLRTIILKVPSI